MLDWKRVIHFAEKGNPEPDRSVRKTDAEWQAQLSPEQYQVTRHHGTERPFSSALCSLFEPGRYACVCCGTLLFDASEKFDSGTGWPSFTQPIKENALAYRADKSHGMYRVETVCNTCEAHLGHVFPDGPAPSGLRYCMNAVALVKAATPTTQTETATFGGGCFWCTEAVFQPLRGVLSVVSGYSGGHVDNPGYRAVCSGATGHAEVVQIVFDPTEITYEDLLRIHLATHDPTTPNQQGADRGTQYRSVIFAHNETQDAAARKVIGEMQSAFERPIVTDVQPLATFYPAEDYHQNYYNTNPGAGYCQAVINPKLKKARELFKAKLR
jgi:peptide methionine sulfoxide reductase msrA/msrB